MFTISIARIIVGCWCGAWYLPEPEGGGRRSTILSFAVDLRLSCALGGGICMLHGRSTIRGVWPSVCEGWWALGRPQCRPELHDTIALLQKWMFDGPVRTSEWVWAGRFAWVGQQGCQATRRAPQTVASISAAASSVDEAMYLRETV